MPLLPLKGVDQMVDEKPGARGALACLMRIRHKVPLRATVIRQHLQEPGPPALSRCF